MVRFSGGDSKIKNNLFVLNNKFNRNEEEKLKKIISKKILLFMSLIVFSILLIGCNAIVPPPTGNNAPVITSTPLFTTA